MGKESKKLNLKNYWQEITLGVSAVIYFLFFSAASVLKHNNFYTGKFDLGNMTQTVWNTLHGNFFTLTNPNGVNEVSRLAFHSDFILIFFTPFYLFWEDPRALLIIQSLILSFGGIFVYLISKEILKNKTLSLVFALCFFLNPAVNFTNLYDFHSVTLATTFLLGAFYFTLKKKWVITILFLTLAGITKEQVWAVTFLLGLYIAFISKQRILGIAISAISLLVFYLLFWHAIPYAARGEHFAVEFYSDFGDSPGEIVKNIIANPMDVAKTLLLPDRIDYVKKLFMPLGFVSFLAFPFLIFAAPDLFINLMSGSPQMHQIYYQYSAVITPFIFIAAIYAVRFLLKKFPKIPAPAVSIFLLAFTFFSAYSYGPLPFAKKPADAWYKSPLENRKIVSEYLKTIPINKRISASNNIGAHLSHRRFIYVMPKGIEEAEMILFLNRGQTEKEKGNFALIENNPDFKLIFNDGDFYVFERIPE